MLDETLDENEFALEALDLSDALPVDVYESVDVGVVVLDVVCVALIVLEALLRGLFEPVAEIVDVLVLRLEGVPVRVSNIVRVPRTEDEPVVDTVEVREDLAENVKDGEALEVFDCTEDGVKLFVRRGVILYTLVLVILTVENRLGEPLDVSLNTVVLVLYGVYVCKLDEFGERVVKKDFTGLIVLHADRVWLELTVLVTKLLFENIGVKLHVLKAVAVLVCLVDTLEVPEDVEVFVTRILGVDVRVTFIVVDFTGDAEEDRVPNRVDVSLEDVVPVFDDVIVRVDEPVAVDDRVNAGLDVEDRVNIPDLELNMDLDTLADDEDVLEPATLRVNEGDEEPDLVLGGDSVFVGELLALFVLKALALTVLDRVDVFDAVVEPVVVFVKCEL